MGHAKQATYNAKSRNKKRDATTGKTAKKPAKQDWKKPNPDDPIAWLLAYLPGAFPLPFGVAHIQIVNDVLYALKHGGNVAIAAPRGTGKSTIVNGLVLWALLEKRTAFPVVVPWDDKAKKRALRFWSQELCHNERIHRDYPEQTDILKRSKGVANRLASLTEDGRSTGARLGLTEGIIVLPNGLGAIGSATINGNPRGLNYATIDGRIIRPTFAIVDDPQDRETARSPTRVRDTIEIIDGDIAGMAGPDERMPIVMPCTVIERDDVAEHYLSSPDWRAIRVGQILTWPEGWSSKGSKTRALWKEWNDIRQGGEKDQDGGEAAAKFYEENKATMVSGMAVSWDHRYDKRRGQPDALYSAMHDYFVMGHEAFMAERQNEPVKQGITIYTLTPDIVASRVSERLPGVYPEWARLRIAATDINPSYGLTWSACGFGVDQTAAVVGYGIHETAINNSATEAQYRAQLFEALVAHGKALSGSSVRPEHWVIDGSGQAFDVVLRFCAESVKLCGLQAVCATGRGARQYRPFGKSVVGKPREQSHIASDVRGRKWIAWNADYWREVAQRGWTGSVGSPGSCSLPQGHHRTFAEQICLEQLAGKGEIGGQMVWTWNTLPGPHDYGDCMAMCYMAAAFNGIGSGGSVVYSKKKKRKRSSVTRVNI